VARPKVEIHLVGLNRALSRTSPSIVRQLASPLRRQASMDHVFRLWLIEREGQVNNVWSQETGFLEKEIPGALADFRVSRLLDAQLRENIRGLARSLTAVEDTWGDGGVTIENALVYLRALKIAAESVSADCDVVVLARPDMKINGQLRLLRLVRRALRLVDSGRPTTLLPAWGTHGGFNDRFAIMPRQHVTTLMNRLDHAPALLASQSRFHSEEFMRFACRDIRTESSIHTTMSRVRLDGRIPPNDYRTQIEHRFFRRIWTKIRKKFLSRPEKGRNNYVGG
jgi:hypothetical protein